MVSVNDRPGRMKVLICHLFLHSFCSVSDKDFHSLYTPSPLLPSLVAPPQLPAFGLPLPHPTPHGPSVVRHSRREPAHLRHYRSLGSSPTARPLRHSAPSVPAARKERSVGTRQRKVHQIETGSKTVYYQRTES